MDVTRDAGLRQALGLILFGIALEVGGAVTELAAIAQGTPGYPSGIAVVGLAMMVLGLVLALMGSLSLWRPRSAG